MVGDQVQGANWVVFLLPLLDQTALYNSWNFNIPAAANPGRSQTLPAMSCPSDPANSASNLCSYAGGNWARGNYGINVLPCSSLIGAFDNYDADINRPDMSGVSGINSSIRISEITDGLSNTIALDELRSGLSPPDLRGSWAMPAIGASGTARLIGDDTGPNNCFPFADDIEECQTTSSYNNSKGCFGCYSSAPSTTIQASSRSRHVGGVQVLLMDGAVKFISENIDAGDGSNCAHVWQSLHTRGGAEVIGDY